MGGETHEFVVTGVDQTFELAFQNSARADEIAFRVPAPVTPQSLGMNDDQRQLGLWFVSMGIYKP